MTTPRTLTAAFAMTTLLATGVSACGGSSTTSSSPESTSPSSAGATSTASGSPTSSSKPSPSVSPSAAVPTKVPVKKGLTTDYPKAAVPLVNGKVLKSTAVAETATGQRVKGWTVQISTRGTTSAALAAVRRAMVGKGFHQQGAEKPLGGGGQEVTYVSAKYQNRVQVGPIKHGAGVVYTVTFR